MEVEFNSDTSRKMTRSSRTGAKPYKGRNRLQPVRQITKPASSCSKKLLRKLVTIEDAKYLQIYG